MKNSFLDNINFVLGNEIGGPNTETLVIISVSLCVGAALFAFGKHSRNWINAKLYPKAVDNNGKEISYISKIPVPKSGGGSLNLDNMRSDIRGCYQ